MRVLELAAPHVKRYRGEVMFWTGHQMVGQELGNGLPCACPEPVERGRYNFFGIPMEFGDEKRQKSEGVTTERTQEAPDGNRIRLFQRDKIAYVAPMPPKASRLIAPLALARF